MKGQVLGNLSGYFLKKNFFKDQITLIVRSCHRKGNIFPISKPDFIGTVICDAYSTFFDTLNLICL